MEQLSFIVLLFAALVLAHILIQSARAFAKKRISLGIRFLKYAGILSGGYLAILTMVSLASRSEPLRPGQMQCFGDWCASVQSLYYADNQLYCTVKIESHSTTGEIQPKHPRIQAVDAQGRSFTAAEVSGPPLGEPVGAGMSATKTYLFYMSPDSERPGIRITEGNWYTRLMAGHPNSFFHARTVTLLQ
jgi:hypothetical protein